MASNEPAATSADIERNQTANFKEAVGQGVPQDTIVELYKYAHDAEPWESYLKHPEIPFMYEIVEKTNLSAMIREVGDSWVQNKSNLDRAARQVQRRLKDDKGILRGFCVFRLKTKAQRGWTPVRDSLGMDQNEPQTVVFIALQDLNERNGFFMTLDKGQDVCLDSRAEIQVPWTGGGMGIFLALNI